MLSVGVVGCVSYAISPLHCRATYFVEYQFPAALLDTKKPSHRQHHLHEIMRVACKKMKDGRKCLLCVP